jgi:mRNA-degrading endonuclease RelE of RelBE toxin-antitoxin system
MTPSFAVRTTPHFDRLLKSLARRHRELTERYAEAFEILGADPYNRTRRYHIKKLEGIPQGEGQYRLSLGRWRFRYDISGRDVILQYCGLRREDTYR